ncbi:MAG: hypothetical protein OXE59_04325 [Bacteroidetes bacterium]|nr:hypothetical protein [Bacteroidota bacterium]
MKPEDLFDRAQLVLGFAKTPPKTGETQTGSTYPDAVSPPKKILKNDAT